MEQSETSTESAPSPTVADSFRPNAPPPNLARFGVALVCVAVGASAFAILFRSAVNVIFTRLYRASDVLDAFSNLPWYLRLLIPACGGGAAGLTGLWASRMFGGQGVGDVMEAVALGERHISLRLASLKAFGSWLAIVAGGSVGREGPIIQFGGGVGDATGHLFRLEERQTRALIAAGTAAGFAAAYNTPLAAVLFVVEVVAGVVALDTVLPAIIATPIATALTRLAVGGGPIYGERTFGMSSNLELVGHVLLGLLAGIVGPAFMGLLEAGERVSERSSLPRPSVATPSTCRSCVAAARRGRSRSRADACVGRADAHRAASLRARRRHGVHARSASGGRRPALPEVSTAARILWNGASSLNQPLAGAPARAGCAVPCSSLTGAVRFARKRNMTGKSERIVDDVRPPTTARARG